MCEVRARRFSLPGRRRQISPPFMTLKTKKLLEIAALVGIGFVGAYFYASTFAADDRIFITDSIAISPSSQPLYYSIFIIGNLVLLAGAAYVGFLIVGFLLERGLLFKTGGAILLVAATVLAVVWFGLGNMGDGAADVFFSGLIVLVLAVLGALMLFGVPGRRSPRI